MPGRPLGPYWLFLDACHDIVFIGNENFLLYHFNMNENYWVSKWSNEQIKALLIEQFSAFWRRDTGIRRTQLATIEQP
jgi:hypothetical protein